MQHQKKAEVDRISAEVGTPGLISKILLNRGLYSTEDIMVFIEEDGAPLHSPFLLTDMNKAVEEIGEAIQQDRKITVFGDYDTDGITATAILYDYLTVLGANVSYYLPSRSDGYGLNDEIIHQLGEQGTELIITVDCGITAVDQAKLASEIGIRLIITDHHQVPKILPEAVAVINPHRAENEYPFADLSGAGVAFKLICALEGDWENSSVVDEYADLAAIGTIADVMPLVGENRSIVKRGLSALRSQQRLGIEILLQNAGVDLSRITAGTISFQLAPRLNASGRMGDPNNAIKLILSDDPAQAEVLAQHICEENDERRQLQADVTEQALTMIESNPDAYRNAIVLFDPRWHRGVIGIVASKIVEKYHLPAILLCEDENGRLKGSGRSVPGLNLFEALSENSDILEGFGGHEMAAGLTVKEENFHRFVFDFSEYVASQLTKSDRIPKVRFDAFLNVEDINTELAQSLSLLEPYGVGNPVPLFALCGVRLTEAVPLSMGKHTRLTVVKEERSFSAVCFGMPYSDLPFDTNELIDLAVTLGINNYGGVSRPQLFVKHIRKSALSPASR